MSERSLESGWDKLLNDNEHELAMLATDKLAGTIEGILADYNAKINYVDIDLTPGDYNGEPVQIQHLPFMPVSRADIGGVEVMFMMKVDAYVLPGGDTRPLAFDVWAAITDVPFNYFQHVKSQHADNNLDAISLRFGTFGLDEEDEDKRPYQHAMFDYDYLATIQLGGKGKHLNADEKLLTYSREREARQQTLKPAEIGDLNRLMQRYGNMISMGLDNPRYKIAKLMGDYYSFMEETKNLTSFN